MTPLILTSAALALILEFEVGGGEDYYNQLLKHPEWPGASSGTTIGIGYDLGYNTKAQFTADWGTLLSDSTIAVLSPCLGKTGAAGKSAAARADVKAVTIPWSAAEVVFTKRTVPRFWGETCAAFPGVDRLPGDAQGALLSLVFNRGGSMVGDRRIEMRGIRDAIAAGNLATIPGLLRSMSRLWKGTDDEKGLTRRRFAEAALFASAILNLDEPTTSAAPPKPGHKIAVKSVAFINFYEANDTVRVAARPFILALRGIAYFDTHVVGFNAATGFLTLNGHDLDGKTGGPAVKGVLKGNDAFCEIRPLATAFGGKVELDGKDITVTLTDSTG